MENNNNKILKPNLFPETVPPPLSPPLSPPPPSQPPPVIWCLHGRCFRGLGAACGAFGGWRGLHCTGAQACHPSGFTLRHSEQFPVTRLQPVRILAGPSGFPLSGGRCGRLNEVLDAGSRIPRAPTAAAGVEFAGLSVLLTDSQLFSGSRRRGFQEVLGPDRERSSRHVSWEYRGRAGV